MHHQYMQFALHFVLNSRFALWGYDVYAMAELDEIRRALH